MAAMIVEVSSLIGRSRHSEDVSVLTASFFITKMHRLYELDELA